MPKHTLALFAIITTAMSVGCSWTINISVYRIWPFIPTNAFSDYQTAHAVHFVPLAIVLGISSLVPTLILAWRGLSNVPGMWLWGAVILAAIPWIGTALYFIPLQGQLQAAGPTPQLVSQLVNADLIIRVLPPTVQCAILCWGTYVAETK